MTINEPVVSRAGYGWLERLLPGAAMLVRYDRSLLRHDALAGLVVALVLIPSAFAYADLAKCAPAAGIYAAAGGMVVFALFTSSRHVIVGPDAAIALLVGATIVDWLSPFAQPISRIPAKRIISIFIFSFQ